MAVDTTKYVGEAELPKVDTGNALTHFAAGVWKGATMPIEGAAQLAGVNSNPYYSHDIFENVGMLVGEGAMFVGGTALARRIPGLRDIAPVAAGGALGFLMPTQEGQGMSTRLERGAMGAAAGWMTQLVPAGADRFGLSRTAGLMRGLAVPGFAIAESSLTNLGLHNPEPIYHEPERVKSSDISQLGAGDYRVSMTSEGKDREYDIHVPQGYDPTKPTRVQYVLDGVSPPTYGGQAKETQFNEYADRDNVIIVYPYAKDGHGAPLTGNVRAWNSEGTGLTARDKSYDDANFLGDVMKDVASKVNVDTHRVSATGFSEGGMFLEKYAAEHPGTFDAIASIHGTLNGHEQFKGNQNNAPNALIIESTADYMLPYNGGKGLMTTFMDPASESKPYTQANFWARANGADNATRSSTQFYTKSEYTVNGQPRVTEYVVNGANHAWDGSGTGGWPIVGVPLRRNQFDTSAVVWKFLRDSDNERPSK